MNLLLLLCGTSFVAGLTDSLVGGGGLVQLPALFIALPNVIPVTVMGTNKMASVWGTSAAAATYVRRVKMDWTLTLICAAFAFTFSRIGAQMVAHVDPSRFKPLLLVMLIAMAAFTILRAEFGTVGHDRVTGVNRWARGALIGIALGFYDGFFGPGTGSLLIFLFIGWIGLDFLTSSATAKVVNMCTNIGALAYFVTSRHVLYHLALPMAACNIAGGITGAHLAIKRGNRFVRVFFILVILAMIARYAVDIASSAR